LQASDNYPEISALFYQPLYNRSAKFQKMLSYFKEKLLKVSFDKEQFNSELSKCRRWLTNEEYRLLIDWARSDIAVYSEEASGISGSEIREKQADSVL
jgi:hypothetical protein